MTDEVEAIRVRWAALDQLDIATLLAKVDRLRESVKSAYEAGFRDGLREGGTR